MKKLKDYGSTALVTGASSGIGKAYATAIAQAGVNLVLVARRENLLNELAIQLKEQYGVEAHTIAQDLTAPNAANMVFDRVQTFGTNIDILVNNAGFGIHGMFENIDIDRELEMITLSCIIPVALTKLFLLGMKERNRGAVVFLSSMAGTMPVPFMSTYSATKAFPLHFAQSLYGELAQTNVDVIAIVPGDTTTEFRDTAGLANQFPIPARSPEQVVQTTFASLGKAPSVIDGAANRLSALAMRLLPNKLVIRSNAKLWSVQGD